MFAVGDCAHAQLISLALRAVYGKLLTLASLVSLIVMDADSGPLGLERSLRFDALVKNR